MFGQNYVELHSFDDVVLTRSPRELARGFVRVPEERSDGAQTPRPENSNITGLQARLHGLGPAPGGATGR